MVRSKAKQKLFHIPLDLSVQAVLRKNGLLLRRGHHAHFHYFTKETARTLTDIGYTIIDWFYTPWCIELGELLVQKMARVPRMLCFAGFPDLTVRVLGGYSLLVLAE